MSAYEFVILYNDVWCNNNTFYSFTYFVIREKNEKHLIW